MFLQNKKSSGLSREEAERRLRQYGKNTIVRREKRHHLRDFSDQLLHPLALLLWGAALLAFLGGIPVLALAILAVIFLNALFAFIQEAEAERATEALRAYLPPKALLRRDGQVREIEAQNIVPGDVILVLEGDRIPADAKILSGSLEVDTSPLTGEAEPVSKNSGETLYSGELCTAGEGEALVQATGMHTELGRIAALSEKVPGQKSPLQLQINSVAKLIAIVAVALGFFFALLGIFLASLPVDEAVTFAIGILVANVPEGLLPTITLALAVAVRKMARRQALLKRLAAVETLGSTDIICTDKTGTLTEGQMEALFFWDSQEKRVREGTSLPSSFKKILTVALACNNAHIKKRNGSWQREGDPSESALLLACQKLKFFTPGIERKTLFRFDPRLKRMTTVDQIEERTWVNSKGAPHEIISLCSSFPEKLTKEKIAAQVNSYAAQGLRVLAFARKPWRGEESREKTERDLEFLGLVALRDPPRAEVREAILKSQEAGISIMVVTGDHALTAKAIAAEVGIDVRQTFSGAEIEGMNEEKRRRVLQEGSVLVARSNPETKLRLVSSLQALGHTVAMTGDGANDAPALRKADIGVAMGASGTDVAREAATMVLADDNFASITAAIEEGRVVYENIKKFITYIFAHATPEVIPFLLFALSGGAIPLPITALQILAIDLGTETLPALALGREPAEPGIMKKKPRPRGKKIVDRAMLLRAWIYLGLVEATLVLFGFFFVLLNGGWSLGESLSSQSELYLLATTMTFAGITACQVGTAFAARTTSSSLKEIGFFSNRLLLWGILFEILFAAAIIFLSPLQEIFATSALGGKELLLLAIFPLVVWASDEIRRFFLRKKEGKL